MRDGFCVGLVCTLAVLVAPGGVRVAAEEEVAPGLAVGAYLDQSNWQLAKDLLPPEILRHYERGEYRNKIAAPLKERQRWDADFEAATLENAKYLDVNDRGTIIDKRTGEQPKHYYGIPFPTIDPKDPKAGPKPVWNNQVNYWNAGNALYGAYIVVLNPKGVDRETVQDVWFLYYDGQGPKLTPPKNPLNLSIQYMALVTRPTDLYGTAAMSWRYRDPDKRDSVWAYVPALRRVRAVSPANRSDGFLGSDISQDDGGFFDGKIEDFSWTLTGERDTLAFADPTSLEGNLPRTQWKDGGWVIMSDPDLPTAGFRTPGWTGLSWAPTDAVLLKRRVWVTEGVPHDKYYLYGKLELWIDQDSWQGVYSRKYAWNGELLQNYATTHIRNHPAGQPEAQEWTWNGSMSYFCVETLKLNRASCAGFRPYPNAPYVRRIPIDPKMFDLAAISHTGK